LSAPALIVTQLPNSATATYFIQTSPDNSSWTTIYAAVITQTGASGAGAAAATARSRLPVECARYVRAGVTTASSPGDCSGASMTLQLVF
jgi:hypothetical protein